MTTKKTTQIRCPKCRNTNHLGTVEWVSGVADITKIQADGTFVYDGGTDIDWNSQMTQTDPQGHPLMHCHNCSTEWFELSLIGEVFQMVGGENGPAKS